MPAPRCAASPPPARLDLAFEVYNTRVVANRPGESLTSTIRLFQEGREAFALPAEPIDLTVRGPGDRISVGRTVRLGPALPPGDYQLQVTVTEERPGKAARRAVQWVDFSARAQPR
jgi:hypothetical protein